MTDPPPLPHASISPDDIVTEWDVAPDAHLIGGGTVIQTKLGHESGTLFRQMQRLLNRLNEMTESADILP